MKLTLDYETRSRCDLKRCGAWVYAEDPSTDVMCAAVKVDDRPVITWVPQKFWVMMSSINTLDTMNQTHFEELLAEADEIEAHNAGFEIAITEKVLGIHVPLEKWRCSAARAAAMALPRSLDGAGAALDLPIKKDDVGHRLMLKMCKPRNPTKNDKSEWHEKPEDLLRLFEYCVTDVEAEYCLSQRLLPLRGKELDVWRLDQIINRRGFEVDMLKVNQALELIKAHEAKLIEEFQGIVNA